MNLYPRNDSKLVRNSIMSNWYKLIREDINRRRNFECIATIGVLRKTNGDNSPRVDVKKRINQRDFN